MTVDEWFDDWNTQKLYQEKVEGCDTCIDGSPIADSGIVCGPAIRLIYVDYEKLLYKGSILLITKNCENVKPPSISYRTGPAAPLNHEVNPDIQSGEFPPSLFFTDSLNGDTFQFYRYSIMLPLTDYEQMIKYSVNGSWEKHFRFFIPSKDTNFNVIAYSCNGFSLSVDTTVFKGSLWFDILNKHSKVHYNVMLGGGDQIYSDRITIDCPKVKHWVNNKELVTKFTTKVNAEFKKELDNFYLMEYIEWYGYGHWKGKTDKSRTTQRCFPLAMATIPSINIWDDHDIIDGFGSYNDTFMSTSVFSSIGKAAYKYYMLFQHHVNPLAGEDTEAYLESKHWILGAMNGAYIGEKSHSVFTRLGPDMAMLGLDCRTERKLREIVSQATYDKVFDRMRKDIQKSEIKHLLVMLGVPISYPRLVWLEWLFSSSLLAPLKYLSKKGILLPGLVNSFNGDVELLDDLNDHWCARYHKRERNHLIARLQDFAAQNGCRVTILSGDVHLASIGLFKSKALHHHLQTKETEQSELDPRDDVRLMFNVISSAVTNTPPPDAMTKLLQARARLHHFDFETDEDSLPIFSLDTDGKTVRQNPGFLNKRNWSDILPVKNVLNNEYLRNKLGIKVGDLIVPNIVLEEKRDPVKVGRMDDCFPVSEDGVIASIHVETDRSQSNSKSSWYMLPIPDLRTKSGPLSHSGMKHLQV